MAFGGAFRRPQSLSNTSREFGSSQSGTEIPEFRQAVAESRSHILKKRESDLAADFHQLKLQSEVVGPHGQSEVVGSHGQSATVLHLTAEVSRSHDVTAVLQGESAASIRCEDIQWVFQMINEHMETSYLYRLEYDSLLGFTIGKDFGTAYAMLRPLWRCFEGHGVLGTAQKEMDNWRAFLHARRKGAIHRDKIGVTMIIDPYQIPPRRVWDLYANRVVDYAYCSFTGSNGWESFVNDQVVSSAGRKLCAISHAWTDDTQTIMTPINGGQWPVTIPVGVDLESIRREVLALGVQYCWLDVLCLRQGVEWDLRKEEWRIDVPTIGNVYREKADTFVLRYYNGLGRCFDNNPALLDGKRHWKNRVWTVQESTGNYMVGGRREKGQDIERDFLQLAVECVMHPHTMNCFIKERDRLFYALLLIHGRQATNEIDKITSISYILRCPTLPAYDIDEKPEDAWGLCISHMPRWGRGELLFRYPVPSDQQESQRRWCPSWE
ncbi:hypothetical protein BZA05DRAFT_359900, partial [Tricharina praecox]|uniref:uncharacterized protein n=1 Tax=Tricharina praecox TaxID=43433 RepID=UPI0022203A96